MVNTEIRLIIFFAAKDGEALYSQQKHCFLYWMDAPTGGPIVEDWGRFFPQSMVVEAGMAMAIAFGQQCLLAELHIWRKSL